jgi:hypothetical protein
MSAFAIGEIAIFARPGSVHYGRECTIVGPLEWHLVQTKQGVVRDYCYIIDGDFQRGRACPPQHLRKRPPPKDWISLCDLRETAPERELETA